MQEQCKDKKKEKPKYEIVKILKIIRKKLLQMTIQKCVNISIT